MRLVTGRVVGGRIEVAGEALVDGEEVCVLLNDDAEAFDLTPEQEQLLLESIREADEGKLIDGPALLRELDRRR